MTSHAPGWRLAVVVAGLLQLIAAENFDHRADQALMSPFGTRLQYPFSIVNGAKVWSPMVRINRLLKLTT